VTFLAIVAFVALFVIRAMLSGWVLSILWGWFLVPLLDFPQIQISHAIVIAIVISFTTGQNRLSMDDNTEALIKAFLMAIIHPLLTLLFAWIVHMFM